MTLSLSSNRAEMIAGALATRPTQLEQRFDWWRKSGISGQAGEMVSRSRGLPMPSFDRMDRTINAAEKQYREASERILKELGLMAAIEKTWLVPVHVASKEEAAQASDSGVDCKRCLRPVACTPADKLLAGMCASCFQWWKRNGRPDIIRIAPEEEQPKRIKVLP